MDSTLGPSNSILKSFWLMLKVAQRFSLSLMSKAASLVNKDILHMGKSWQMKDGFSQLWILVQTSVVYERNFLLAGWVKLQCPSQIYCSHVKDLETYTQAEISAQPQRLQATYGFLFAERGRAQDIPAPACVLVSLYLFIMFALQKVLLILCYVPVTFVLLSVL